jgi:bifunctional non-homologous end joining protein LigD
VPGLRLRSRHARFCRDSPLWRPISLCAFDLLELDGRDVRAAPIEERKGALADLLKSPRDGIAFNENFSGDGATIYKHACGLGCEVLLANGSAHPIAPAAVRIG